MISLGLWGLFMFLFLGVVIFTEKIKEKKK
ncbi:hypothetical protein LGMT14_02175 [Lactococcus garvieae]|nr:hypothetical protein LGMT14_02175 [Lactococcus garvieae]